MTALGIVAGLAIVFVIVTFIFRRVAKQLSPLIGRNVRVEAWGQELAGTEVTSVLAIGAGVHVMVSGHHIKLAQPRDVTSAAGRIEIAWAKYVQYDGKKVRRSDAPAIVFRDF